MMFKPAFAAALAWVAASAHATPVMQPVPATPAPYVQPVLGQAVTNQVLVRLQQGEAACAQLGIEYQADCLRQVFRAANNEIRRRPDYRAASQELRTLDRQLDSLVESNIDRAAPVLRVQGRRVRAVQKAIAPQVNAAARRAITESATRLLRSSGSAEAVAQLTQIAQAVNSTKRILRS
ncbi:MAG: hypothetical protein AAF744_10915 [Pseudomonadota bacterium]